MRNHGFEGGPHRAAHLFIAELISIRKINYIEDMATHQNRFLLVVNRECFGHGPYNLGDFGYIKMIYLKLINHCVSQTWSKTVGLSRIEGTTSFGIGTFDELPLERLTFIR